MTAAVMAMASAIGLAQGADGPPIRDLRDLKQDCRAYLAAPDGPLVSAERKRKQYDYFRRMHYAPWNEDKPSSAMAKEMRDAFDRYAATPGFGENCMPHDRQWVESLRKNAGLEQWPNNPYRAITVRNSDLRELPTRRPVFETREDYPFDRLQNTAVWAGTPAKVWHTSLDGAWAYVQVGYASGWMPAADMARVNEEMADDWQRMPLAALLRDDVPFANGEDGYRFTTHIGAVFPYLAERDGGVAVTFAVRNEKGVAVAQSTWLGRDRACPMPLPATPAAVAMVANRLLGQPYGWGGLYENRDCSSTLRDLFVPFGLWLPRNSGPQARAGRVVSLAGLSPADKQATIRRQGVPLLTLLGMRGHIMLYVGQAGGQAAILHNYWGVRVRTPAGEQRRHVGACVITTLRPGGELPNIAPGSDLAGAIETMTILDAPPEDAK